jgi:hypothetical protein
MWSKDIDELGMINQSEKGSTCARVFKIILITFMCGLMVSYKQISTFYYCISPYLVVGKCIYI